MKLFHLALATCLSASALGCSDAEDDPVPTETAKADLVDTASQAGTFGTLVAAVKAAGLEATLRSPGPFTVFAPNDAAFQKLPPGTVDSLLLPENKSQLTAVLTYHVVASELSSSQVVARDTLPTVQGGQLRVSSVGSEVRINDAKVLAVDVDSSNGVIHVIDSVLLPE